MSDLFTLVFIASIGIAIGVAIGVLYSGVRNKEVGSEEQPGATPEELLEILSVWRNASKQDYVVELNNQRYASASELNSGDLEFIKRTLKELDVWTGPPPVWPDLPLEEVGLMVEANQMAVTAEPAAPAVTGEAPKPTLNPVSFLARALRNDVRKPEVGPRSIVAQIDDILQEKLLETPEITRSLQLKEAPDGSMVVMDGVEQYPDVDSVPDELARKLIKDSVAEWERRVSS